MIEKNIPNKISQTRVFHLIPFPKYWRFRAYFGLKELQFQIPKAHLWFIILLIPLNIQ